MKFKLLHRKGHENSKYNGFFWQKFSWEQFLSYKVGFFWASSKTYRDEKWMEDRPNWAYRVYIQLARRKRKWRLIPYLGWRIRETYHAFEGWSHETNAKDSS